MTYIYDEDMKLFSPEMIEEIQNQNPFVRISEAVYSILEDAILSSKLRPGSKLKINKIADELNVSGTPVREAVERLTSRGLVIESMINGGKYKNYYVFDLSEDDIENLFEARKAIESVACYACAEKNWKVDMKKLHEYADGFEKDMRDFMSGKSETVSSIRLSYRAQEIPSCLKCMRRWIRNCPTCPFAQWNTWPSAPVMKSSICWSISTIP